MNYFELLKNLHKQCLSPLGERKKCISLEFPVHPQRCRHEGEIRSHTGPFPASACTPGIPVQGFHSPDIPAQGIPALALAQGFPGGIPGIPREAADIKEEVIAGVGTDGSAECPRLQPL